MKQFTFLLLLLSQFSFAQSNLVVETINKIEFQQDSIKSVFDWITANVKYDVDKLTELKKNPNSNKSSNFKSSTEYKEHRLHKVIKQKKGVCEDYAILFDAILQELGYESYIIEGYTKTKKGKVNLKIGHAWNAVRTNGEWKLYDATWGAGYVDDGNKFIKKYSPEWHDVEARDMIKSHMPYDPVWQLLETPMNYEEFENNREATSKVEKYDYNHFLQELSNTGEKEQMQAQLNRSLEMGAGIRLLEKWRKRMTKNVECFGVTSQQGSLEKALKSSNEAVELINEYGKCKTKQFKGKKYSLENARQKLEQSEAEVQSALEIYKSIEVEDTKALNSINMAINKLDRLQSRINKESRLLDKLLNK